MRIGGKVMDAWVVSDSVTGDVLDVVVCPVLLVNGHPATMTALETTAAVLGVKVARMRPHDVRTFDEFIERVEAAGRRSGASGQLVSVEEATDGNGKTCSQ